jgi:serine/threonine protein kinase
MRGAEELSGTITAGSYRLVRALGADDGRVHEARHDRLAGRFAVKLFGEVEPGAFQRGAQQASALRHPGIVKVVDYGAAPGAAFVVMEWVEGRSLADIIARDGALAPDAVARIVDSVALGLQAAHRQGLTHGHLTPERVLVLAPGGDGGDETPGAERTKIVGFGLDQGAAANGLDITEVTPYSAPELLANDASPLADQYALGAIAYELLTGLPPAQDAAARRPPRSIREYDPTINVIVDDVVQRAISPDPDARWADVYTFSQRLREATDAGGALEEKTRLAPLPLTVSRPSMTPTPIELPPVIASVDVDLGTPPPKRLEDPRVKLPLQGDFSMNPPPSRPSQSFRGPSQLPAPFTSPRPSAAHYGIRPTPTFSFTDQPEPGPLYKPPGTRRRGRSSGLGLVLIVLFAGAGGYFAMQTRVWETVEPVVRPVVGSFIARAKNLGRSLWTLAPWASPEPAAPASASAPTSAPTQPNTPATAAANPATNPTAAPAASPVPAAPPPTLHPEVVPIAPIAPRATAAQTSPSTHHSSHAHHQHAQASGRPVKALSDEAAAEEALLAAPTRGR